ncbi:MAG: Rieske (2Fe-2S) protein [Trebonia sp.]
MIQADGDVLCAGALADVFGDADRAVLCLERDGSPVEELLVLRLRGRLFALVNRCPHLGRELDDARVHGYVLTCRGHGKSYSLRSGRMAGARSWRGPVMLRSVRAWDEGGKVFLDITAL